MLCNLVYELHRALGTNQRVVDMENKGGQPGPMPNTVVEPAAICVLPLNEGSLIDMASESKEIGRAHV